MEKMDRRVTRTRGLLRDALLSLLMEKKHESITIQDITDRANLGRATFYLHYKDKDDLLFQVLKEGFDSLVMKIERKQEESGMIPAKIVEDVFLHVQERKKLYLALLRDRQTGELLQGTHQYVVEKMKQRFFVSLDNTTVVMDAAAEYMAGAMISLVIWWLQADAPIPTDEVAEIFVILTAQGLSGLGIV